MSMLQVSCAANDTCNIDTSYSVTVSQSLTVNVAGIAGTKRSLENSSLTERQDEVVGSILDILKATFNMTIQGASFQIAQSTTKAISQTNDRPTETLAYCGYWTA